MIFALQHFDSQLFHSMLNENFYRPYSLSLNFLANKNHINYRMKPLTNHCCLSIFYIVLKKTFTSKIYGMTLIVLIELTRKKKFVRIKKLKIYLTYSNNLCESFQFVKKRWHDENNVNCQNIDIMETYECVQHVCPI